MDEATQLLEGVRRVINEYDVWEGEGVVRGWCVAVGARSAGATARDALRRCQLSSVLILMLARSYPSSSLSSSSLPPTRHVPPRRRGW